MSNAQILNNLKVKGSDLSQLIISSALEGNEGRSTMIAMKQLVDLASDDITTRLDYQQKEVTYKEFGLFGSKVTETVISGPTKLIVEGPSDVLAPIYAMIVLMGKSYKSTINQTVNSLT